MIKRVKAEADEILANLALKMWTDHYPEEMAEEFRDLVMNEEAVCFIKYEDDKPIGSYVSRRIYR